MSGSGPYDTKDDNYKLLRKAVKPITRAYRKLGLESNNVFITFLFYDLQNDKFKLVDYTNINPLFKLHKEAEKHKGGFYYAYRVIDNGLKYEIGSNLNSTDSPWPKDIRSKADKLKIKSVVSMPVIIRGKGKRRYLGVINSFYSDNLKKNTLVADRRVANSFLISVGIRKHFENIKYKEKEIESKIIEKELIDARKIHQDLLPPENDEWLEFELCCMLKPSVELSGDIITYRKINDDYFVFTVADVRGHGPSASLLAMQYYALFHALCMQDINPCKLAVSIDTVLKERFPSDDFITAFIGLISLKNNTLTYVNAGQPNVLHYSWDMKNYSVLDTTCPVLGTEELLSLVPPEQNVIEFRKGDLLAILTDGFWEIKNDKEIFMEEDLIKEKILTHYCDGRPLNIIASNVYQCAEEFKGSQPRDDDQTMLLVRRYI